MDLTLSRTGDYAVRAAIGLAGAWPDDGFVTIARLAGEMDLPAPYTPQVVGLLVRAGLVASRPGRGGGYRLSRSPEEISMLEVVEAAEGPLASITCPLSGGPCRWEDACAIHPTWTDVASAVRSALAGRSLADIAREDRELGVASRRRAARKAELARP